MGTITQTIIVNSKSPLIFLSNEQKWSVSLLLYPQAFTLFSLSYASSPSICLYVTLMTGQLLNVSIFCLHACAV